MDSEGSLNDHVLYLFRETSGVGDFVGMTMSKVRDERPRPPPPMAAEVKRMLGPKGGAVDKEKALPEKPPVDKGDRVRRATAPSRAWRARSRTSSRR